MQPPASDTFRRPLGVFWDIENCGIPRGKSALAVCEKIRGEDFCQGHSEIQFAVVCDATKESPFVLDDLLKAQVGRGTRTDESYLIACYRMSIDPTFLFPYVISSTIPYRTGT